VGAVPDAAEYHVLYPPERAGLRLPPDPGEAALLALFDDPPVNPATGAHIRAVMLASADGAVTGADGVAGSVGDPGDRRLFAALRALADVVLVGAGTVRAEGYRDVQVPHRLRAARAARGRPDRVTLAVVTGTGVLPEPALDGDPLVITSSGAPGLAALRAGLGDDRVIVADGPTPGQVDVGAAVRALAARGLTRVHAEGGPTLLAALVAAGAVDELCLTLGPLLVGGPAPRVLDTPTWLDPPVHLELAHLLRADDTLLGRWRVATAADRPEEEHVPETIVVLAEDALSAADVAHVVGLHAGEELAYRVLVPADTDRPLLPWVLDSIGLGELRAAWDRLTGDEPSEPQAKATAEQQLARSLAAFRAAGSPATGAVVDDDPLPALRAAVEEGAREVVVATYPHLVEDTFHRDWASRAREALHVPVLHLYLGTSELG